MLALHTTMSHIPVLLHESIEGLNIHKPRVRILTVQSIAEVIATKLQKLLGKDGTLICIDLDEVALEEAEKKR